MKQQLQHIQYQMQEVLRLNLLFQERSSQGQAVKAGDTVVILESMKMEIPVVAPQDGTIASIAVSQGNNVENGAVLATMN